MSCTENLSGTPVLNAETRDISDPNFRRVARPHMAPVNKSAFMARDPKHLVMDFLFLYGKVVKTSGRSVH